MTREEAISKAINIVRYFEAHFAKSKEAREDAANIIEALEQEPCEDCISREKALQIIRVWFDREATPSDLKNEIEQLPPVIPQQKVGRWIEHFDESGKWYECDQCHRSACVL